jgi:hypothetical protein
MFHFPGRQGPTEDFARQNADGVAPAGVAIACVEPSFARYEPTRSFSPNAYCPLRGIGAAERIAGGSKQKQNARRARCVKQPADSKQQAMRQCARAGLKKLL